MWQEFRAHTKRGDAERNALEEQTSKRMENKPIISPKARASGAGLLTPLAGDGDRDDDDDDRDDN